ncbi:glycosyltransferase [Cytobacillus solani]|uniref:glycosyltransferase n=1 Tax=Cytobacillus solani TaxID=1637975 RepID=UPI001FEAC00F|nr:glycosyltransferase [Cytobacillus solani]
MDEVDILLTSIIILTYNNLEYTKQCLESIRKYTDRDTYELIIIDNNSVDDTKEWLLKQDDIRVIINKENLGFPRGCNQGIGIAKGENILLLNNDVIVTENWLSNMVNSLYSEDRIGAVGPVTNSAAYYTAIPVEYSNLNEMHNFAQRFNKSDSEKWEERLKLIGYCMLIKREVVDKIGLLDERFTPGNFEDDDYSVRIRQAGYKLLLCKDTFIHHYGSVSWKENISGYGELLSENEKKFMGKWGTNSSSYIIHHDLISKLPFHEEAEFKILHIGCKSGGTLLKIKDKFKHASLYGMETNKYEVSEVERIANIIKEDEPLSRAYSREYFDAILITDFKQYVPSNLLKEVKRCLKKNGILLAKMRNVSSYSNISKLILAENPYNFHEVYFSRSDIRELFDKEYYYQFENEQEELNNERLDFIQTLMQMGSKEIADFAVQNFLVKASFKDEEIKQFVIDIYENKDIETNLEKLLCYDDDVIIGVINEMNNPEEVLNVLAISIYSYQQFERVLPYLEAAFKLDSKSSDTIYNIAFILHSFGENNSAAEFLELLENMDNEALTLYKQITEKIRFNQQELIMLLRRIEYEIDLEQSIQTLIKVLLDPNITTNEIIMIIENNIIQKVKVLNIIGITCYEQGFYEDILVYLNKSYDIDKNNDQTLYNLGFFLHKLGENKSALNYLVKIQHIDKEIELLISEVQKILQVNIIGDYS